jgi:hypothetical protein
MREGGRIVANARAGTEIERGGGDLEKRDVERERRGSARI